MADSIRLIVQKSFSEATLIIDRLYVKNLALNPLQENRIKHRSKALVIEKDTIDNARNKYLRHTPKLLHNRDRLKQERSNINQKKLQYNS
jgi:hypothetical protein